MAKNLKTDENGLNCDSDVFRGPEFAMNETVKLIKNDGINTQPKTVKRCIEIGKVEKLHKGGPHLTLKSPQNRGQLSQKKRGKKMDSVDDPKQLKLDMLWGKKKKNESDDFSSQ